MQLGDLLDDTRLDLVTSSIEISSVEIDSRDCREGSLFFALPGERSHGARFLADAVARGAVAIVASEPVDVQVPVVHVPASQSRALMSHASATITGHPESRMNIVGVTGTNGKTSVANMVSDLARSLQWNGAALGTLTNERTTPAAPELFRSLQRIAEDFDPALTRTIVALEVSSHALDQHRVEGLRFAVAAFTNLSHDHLDYHGTMESYFLAKAKLFTPEYAQRAVIWCDDSYGQRLAEATHLGVTPVRRVDAADVMTSLAGTTFFWRNHLVNTPLVGGYNVDNALMAMTIVSALGGSDVDIARAMADVRGVRGRFEVIHERDIDIVIDYAHTPVGLRRLLLDVRTLAPSARVVTVFGCGGDRDRTKRPEMGAVASELSDAAIVTSDNPRSESPDDIIDAIMAGVRPGAAVQRISDRREAIVEALALATPGDVVVIAGKGHETTQTIGDVVVNFDDAAVARELLK